MFALIAKVTILTMKVMRGGYSVWDASNGSMTHVLVCMKDQSCLVSATIASNQISTIHLTHFHVIDISWIYSQNTIATCYVCFIKSRPPVKCIGSS